MGAIIVGIIIFFVVLVLVTASAKSVLDEYLKGGKK